MANNLTVRQSPTRQDTFIVHMKCAGQSTGVWDKKLVVSDR